MNHLDQILKLVEGELGAVARNGRFRNREEIDSVYKLIDIAKDCYKIWCMEAEMDEESRGYSYAKPKRDRMGRYSRDNEYLDKLHEMMEEAPDEQTRQSIQRMISDMERH